MDFLGGSNDLKNFMLNQAEEIHRNNMARIQKDMDDGTHKTNLVIERSRTEQERERADNMASTVGFYRNLLSRPMEEIAAYSVDFRKKYLIQQQTLSNWVLSQKAFKDLAYDLGISLGFGEAKVDAIYLERVEEIATETNANEAMPKNLKGFAERSKETIREVIAEKYSGKIPVLSGENKTVLFTDYAEELEAKKPKVEIEMPPQPPKKPVVAQSPQPPKRK